MWRVVSLGMYLLSSTEEKMSDLHSVGRTLISRFVLCRNERFCQKYSPSLHIKVGIYCKLDYFLLNWLVNIQSRYRSEVSRGFQEVKVPRLRNNDPGCW